MFELFAGDLGIMVSALLIFAGMTDFIILVLFFSKQRPTARVSDIQTLTPEQKKQIHQRLRRYQIVQFSIAMSGLLMVAAGMYGIATQMMSY